MRSLNPLVSLLTVVLLLSVSSCQTDQHKVGVEGRFIGSQLDEGVYQDADEPTGGAFSILTMPIQGSENLWGWEIGAGEASDSFNPPGVEYKVQERNAWFGVRYNFLDGHVRPFLATGIQYSQHEIALNFSGTQTTRSTDDYGPYGEVGMRVRLNRDFHFVLGYRQSFGLEGRLESVALDLDSKRAFFGFGWSF